MNHCWSHQLWDTEKKLHRDSQNVLLANGSKGFVLNGDVQWGCIETTHLQHVSLPEPGFRRKLGQRRRECCVCAILIASSLQSSNVQVKVIFSKIKSMQISHMFYNFVPGTKKGQS